MTKQKVGLMLFGQSDWWEGSKVPGLLLHTEQIQNMMEKYLGDTRLIIDESLAALSKSKAFRLIYKTSLAADAVLLKLSNSRMKPGLNTLRSIDLRIPLLVAVRQTSIAKVELRRFIELCNWSIYFTDHSVEWSHFASEPKKGFQNSIEKPISYCAHREASFYSNYVLERMKDEPSGIGHQAISSLKNISSELNAVVHPGNIAISRKKIPPVDDISEQMLMNFTRTQKAVFSNSCILIAAFNRKQFNNLPPMHRSYFDWLVGAKLKKTIRAGAFGITS
jgi:hypothetical protein